jgi:hypothetical protein
MAILYPLLDCSSVVIDITPNPIVKDTPVTGTITIPYYGGSTGPYNYPSVDFPIASPFLSTANTGITATLRPGVTPTPSFPIGNPGTFILDITGQVSENNTNAIITFAIPPEQLSSNTCIIELSVETTPSVESLACADAVKNIFPNPVIPNTPVTGTVIITYTGGNGSAYPTQVVNSSYNEGLTATLVPGVLSDGGGGTIVFNITGQVTHGGETAVFDFSFADNFCQFAIQIPTYYPQGNQWYALYPCYDDDSGMRVIFSKASALADYVNETKYLQWGECSNYPPEYLEPCGCYTIKMWNGPTPTTNIFPNINEDNIDVEDTCEGCTSFCLIVGGTGTVSYISSENEQITTSLPAMVCSSTKLYIKSTSTPTVEELSECSSSNDCQIDCYELTNCKTGQIIYSNSSSLFNAFAGNKAVELYEYDGCWTVDRGIECECLVEVTIKNSYVDCITCLPIIAYVLTNCENELLQKFSEEDLSPYVGKIVSLDCGDCWYVDQIDYKPPQTQEFVVENAYESCEQCSRAYFILFDCEGSLEPITTFTDMTAYLDSTLKLAGYTGCWTVQTSPTPDYENAVGVSVTTEFEDCDTCQTVTGCTCTKLKNISTVQSTASYLDCSGVQQTVTLDAGESTTKICVNRWLSKNPAYFETTEFGDCVENESTGIKECAAALTGRMVRPGYTAPTCDTEKFERITCETAEILYKQVLQLRYGISNCCPEDDDKALVKKEIIDIQALNDKDYICSNLENCNCSSCNN